jgi:hypothetical protein
MSVTHVQIVPKSGTWRRANESDSCRKHILNGMWRRGDESDSHSERT